MDYKNLAVSLFLVVSSWVGLSYSQVSDGSMSCLQKLIPCQIYLKATSPSSSPPPDSCCVPLKEAMIGESECLCKLYNQSDLLKNFGTNIDEALALAKSCGASPDISVCNATTAATSPPLPGNTSAGSPANSTNSTLSEGSKTESKAAEAIHFGGTYVVTLFLALIVSAAHMQ